MMSSAITDRRRKTVHMSTDDNPNPKPLCRPHTMVTFFRTLRRSEMSVCTTCAERDLLVRYENGER